MRFVLMCQVLDGEPPVHIKWFKDNQELTGELTTSIGQQANNMQPPIELLASDELGSSLLFRRVLQQHSGNYTCLATNQHGSTSYSSSMSVKGKLSCCCRRRRFHCSPLAALGPANVMGVKLEPTFNIYHPLSLSPTGWLAGWPPN